MAYLKCSKASCLYNVIAAKSCDKTRLVQYIIPGKSPFKTSIDALQVMLSSLKNRYRKNFVCWLYSLIALYMACHKTH